MEHASEFYQREVDPLLTPITIDPAHPFPRVLNKALCLALLLRSKRKRTAGAVLGVVTVPRALPRLVPVPSSGGTIDYIFLHELIEANAARMYRGYEVLSTAAFRVTRNSNLYLQEEETRSLLESVRTELHNRRKGDAVRLEMEAGGRPRDHRPAARELRGGRIAGSAHRWSGEPLAADDAVHGYSAARPEVSAVCPSRAAHESEFSEHL